MMLRKDFLKEWNILEHDFPLSANLEEQIKFCLNYAVLAPSTHNTQPWLFRVEGIKCTLLINSEIKLPEADPENSYLYISLGACLENLIIAADHFGIFRSVKYFDNKSEKIAEVVFGKSKGIKKDGLIKTIPNRINARGFFKNKKVPATIISKLNKTASFSDLSISLVDTPEKIKKVAALTSDAIGKIYSKKDFRKELSSLINSNFTTKKSGMPGYALKFTNLISLFFPTILRLKDVSPVVSKVNYMSIVTMPLAICVSSAKKDKLQFVKAGQYIERLLLTLKSEGVDSSIFIASLELDKHREEIKKIFKTPRTPIFLWGSGYVKGNPKHTPRIPAYEKLIK